MKRFLIGAALAAMFLMASCGQEHQSSSQVNYNEVKSMVVDILKTEDGQKAIQEAAQKSTETQTHVMQILATGQGQQLQMAVKEVMSDPAYAAALKETMIDPRFAGDFAKAITKENTELHKKLIKDPEYQQAMIDIFKDPQIQAMILQTMKSNEYRQQVMSIMKDAIQSPLFQQELLKLMEKALEEQAKPKSDAEKGAKASSQAAEKESGEEGSGGESGGEEQKKEEEDKRKEEEK